MVAGIATLVTLRFMSSFALPSLVSKSEAQTVTTPLGDIVSETVTPHKKHSPSAIYLAKEDLTLPIAEGVISGDEWTLYEDKVSWLATSAEPGKGNVIVYAHNRPGLFGNLKNFKVGDEISVEHAQKWFTYKVVTVRKVTPADIDAVLANDNQLTLYTCDGKFDQKRLIIIATPISAS